MMSIVGVVMGVLIIALVTTGCRFIADLIVPQSEIDKIDAIGRWAKEELDRRKAERGEE